MAIHLQLADSIHSMRASVWRSGSASAGFRRIQPIGRWSLTGMLIASILALANSWFLDTEVTRLLLAQSRARAMDHVRLGILSHVNAEDFIAPHTRARLADIQARLNPVLAGLSANGAGTVDVDLVAADGTIIYSEIPDVAGLHAPPEEQWLLEGALAGRITTMLESVPQHPGVQGEGDYDRVLEVYVPVSMDGLVVGAYELDVRLPPTPLNHPILITLMGGIFAAALYIFVSFAAARMRRRDAAVPQPGEPLPAAQREPNPNIEALDRLTRRELDVLRSLAIGHSYREIATELILGEETIRSHVKRILRKTGQPNRTALVTAAHRAGILDTPKRAPGAELKERQGPTLISRGPGQASIQRIHPRGGYAASADSPPRVIVATDERT
jgi:DNA-binding CsgD family transcriptional regulator